MITEDSKEVITIVGTTLDGVSVIKNLEDEDGLCLTEIADALVVFIRAMGYTYVESVDFYCGDGVEHGSSF